jgi:F-box protein 11
MWLGIDFGTCYSSAAFTMGGDQITMVKEPLKHTYCFPSSIYLTEQGNMLVGEAAENQRLRDVTRYRHEFKRHLGQNEPLLVGERKLRPEELVAEVLGELRREAEETAEGCTFPGVIITVPATYADYKRDLMQTAGEAAGFRRVRLLEEPAAAAIYYAQSDHVGRELAEDEIIMVYDLGGGTFDAALVQKMGARYQLLAEPVGLEQCGGTDFDREIFEDLKGQVSSNLAELLRGRDLNAMRGRLMVAELCQDLKHQLSADQEARVLIPLGDMEEVHLHRDTFEAMIAPYVEQTVDLCHRLVEQNAGLQWGAIGRLLLVGGSCRIPYVKNALAQLGPPVVRVDDPELAVCRGAAVYGGELAEKLSHPVVASGGGRAKFTTLAEALGQVEPGARIQVEPGVYRGSVVLDKPVEIVGDGPVEEVVLEASDGPCLWIEAGQVSVQGLTIRRLAGPSEDKLHSSAVTIIQEKSVLKDCDISADAGPCVTIAGAEAKPFIVGCTIHDGKSEGIAVFASGQGTVEDCDIHGHAGPGVAIREGGQPTIRGCRIHDGKSAGISVDMGGRGVVEDCDIYGQVGAGVAICRKADPILRGCKIHDGQAGGILVATEARGKVEACDIFGNAGDGVAILAGGQPYIRGCMLHDGGSAGVAVHRDGQGVVEDCDIFGNTGDGVEISEGGDPIVRGCKIHNWNRAGARIHANGKGQLEACDIFGNALCEVAIVEEGDPVIRECKIHDGQQAGVLVHTRGKGRVEACDIFGNASSGVEIREEGDPVIRECKIHDGQQAGVLVHTRGKGQFEACDIIANALSGVEIREEGDPVIRECKIHDGHWPGVLVHASGKGRVEGCDIFANALSGVEISEGGNPIIQECRIHDGQQPGVLVHTRGKGQFEACDIFANALSGVEIREEGDSVIQECTIRENLRGIWVRSASVATVEGCDLWDNASVSWQIEGGTVHCRRTEPWLWSCARTLVAHPRSSRLSKGVEVAVGPDGRTLASGSRGESTVKIWDLAAGKTLHTLRAHSSWVYTVTFSPDGEILASASLDKTIKLWNPADGQEIRTLRGHSGCVNSVAFTPDGRILVSGSDDNTVKLWDLSGRQEIRTLSGHSDSVYSVAFSPDGEILASGSLDSAIKLWNPADGQEIRTLRGHSGCVHSVAFTPDGQILVSGSSDNTVKLWDLPTGQVISTLTAHSGRWFGVEAVATSPDGQLFASCGAGETIKIWRLSSCKLVQTLEGHSKVVTSIAFSPDGRTLVTGSGDNSVRIWQSQ